VTANPFIERTSCTAQPVRAGGLLSPLDSIVRTQKDIMIIRRFFALIGAALAQAPVQMERNATSQEIQLKILAFAVYELRLLLSGHLGSTSESEPSDRAAAHLAYALHNQALAVLEGGSFDPSEAVEAIARVDRLLGENFGQRLSQVAGDAV